VTGLAANSTSYLYVSSRAQNATYRYTAPAVASPVKYTTYTGASQTRDIAITSEGNIWVARDDPTTMPLRLYNANDVMIDNILDTLVPSACGVTMDESGYLWVSDTDNDCIYKIDLTEGIEGSGEGITPYLLASSNPFAGQVTITGIGFDSQSIISIYDIRGNLVSSDSFFGSYMLGDSGDLSQGIYFARVRCGSGSESVLKLTCL